MNRDASGGTVARFDRRIASLLGEHRLSPRPQVVDTLWMNITRRCNQACSHCHVSGSPSRTGEMDRAAMDACLAFLARHEACATLDITGGAPELHPDFEYLVARARAVGKRVVVRTNLTALLGGGPDGRGPRYLPGFLAANRVELIASLPHYEAAVTDRVRGDGVHAASLKALGLLNRQGYGHGRLVLNLMHNAESPLCPADRQALEDAYRRELSRLGLRFDSLYTVTNVPIARYRRQLEEKQTCVSYLENLASRFSPDSVEVLACRSLVSVGPDGTLYDCDFNQAANLPIMAGSAPLTIFTADLDGLLDRTIRFAGHCLGCTAGGGSS